MFFISILDAVRAYFGRHYPSTQLLESELAQRIGRWFTAIKDPRLKLDSGSSSVLAIQPVTDSANGTMVLASSETTDPSAAEGNQDEDWEDEDQQFDDLELPQF